MSQFQAVRASASTNHWSWLKPRLLSAPLPLRIVWRAKGYLFGLLWAWLVLAPFWTFRTGFLFRIQKLLFEDTFGHVDPKKFFEWTLLPIAGIAVLQVVAVPLILLSRKNRGKPYVPPPRIVLRLLGREGVVLWLLIAVIKSAVLGAEMVYFVLALKSFGNSDFYSFLAVGAGVLVLRLPMEWLLDKDQRQRNKQG